jgi:energy-coupling factor transporter ATP-binding protein EcfA2
MPANFAQPGATIQYLSQEPDLAGFDTTRLCEAGFDAGAVDGRHRALYLLKELGLSGDEHPASLSGGEARAGRAGPCTLASPDILLLDEPTNHLDLPGIEWLEQELAGIRSGIVLISHDRRLLERFSRSTVWLDRGFTRVLDEGFSAFEAWRDEWYAGGYTDMLAQRAAPPPVLPAKARSAMPSRPATQSSGSPDGRSRRMNFNNRRMLDMLPGQIAALETQITGLNAVLADADLYARDPACFGATTDALAAARDELAAAEEQWLRLEMLREEIEAAEPRSDAAP